MMADVRIAWYSNAERDVYHLCQNCRHNHLILRENLVAGKEQEIINDLWIDNSYAGEEDLLCEHCKCLLDDGTGITLTIPVN